MRCLSLRRGARLVVRSRAVRGLALALLAGCRAAADEPPHRVAGGDAERGRAAIERYGCGACHTVPGVRAADGVTGPPLVAFGRRGYIAGRLPNVPDSLVQWLMAPQRYEPGRAMPNMGVTERDARDMAAYLYTLR
jgi:cytochrome c2